MSTIGDMNQALQDAFMFQPSDLEANKRRELSRRQMALMRGTAKLALFGAVIFGLVMLVGMPLLFVALNSGSGASTRDALVMGLIAGGIGFLLGAGTLAYYVLRGNDQRKARMTVSQGVAQPVKGRGEYEYKVRVGATTLRFGLSTQASAFTTGASYRVYHLKQGMLDSVLSAEVLPEPVAPSSEQFIALNAADINKPDAEAERKLNNRLVRAGMGIFIAIAILVIAIPLTFVLTASMPPLVQAIVYIVVLLAAIGFPFGALSLLGRAAPDASVHLAEARSIAEDVVEGKLDDLQ